MTQTQAQTHIRQRTPHTVLTGQSLDPSSCDYSRCTMSHSSSSTDQHRTKHKPSMHLCPRPHDHSHTQCMQSSPVCCTRQPRMIHKLLMDQSQHPPCPKHTRYTMCSHSATQFQQHTQCTVWPDCRPSQQAQAHTHHTDAPPRLRNDQLCMLSPGHRMVSQGRDRCRGSQLDISCS